MTTYLVKKHGKLESVTSEEWKKIVSQDAKKPVNKRRHFIIDAIEFDRLIIEVTEKKYREWNRERMSIVRSGCLDEEIQLLSFDEPIDETEETTMYDIVSDNDFLGEDIRYEEMLRDLVFALKQWKPWGQAMLQQYLKGCNKEINGMFAQMYGISPRRVRACKQEFEKFVREFIANRA